MTLSLRHVHAAQMRTRATRTAIGQVALATAFLAGALAYARAPDRRSDSNVFWMTFLLILSTLDVTLGLRTLARLRRQPAAAWIAASMAWGLLSVAVVVFLLRG